MKIDSITTTKNGSEFRWNIVRQNKDGSLLLCAANMLNMPFYDPNSTAARYLRIDYSGKGNSAGVLMDVEPMYSQLKKSKKKNAEAEESDRHAQIRQYGCNQWAVSDIRTYLNGEFRNAFPEDFLSHIVPQKHTLLLGFVPATGRQSGMRSELLRYTDTVQVYDEFTEKGTRNTYSITEDCFFVPSLDEYKNNSEFFEAEHHIPFSDGEVAKLFWLMDAHPYGSINNSLVKIAALFRRKDGSLSCQTDYCNANTTKAVLPMCVYMPEYNL